MVIAEPIGADQVVDNLHDPYPLGWEVTYRVQEPTGRFGDGLRVGVVTGTPVRDPGSGVESFPLSPADGAPSSDPVWIREDDIIGIMPSWDQPEPRHG